MEKPHMHGFSRPSGSSEPHAAAVIARLTTPVWVFDIERTAMLWANPAALRLWEAESLEELRARDFRADISGPVRTRLLHYLERFRRDETVVETWTLYPHGNPVTLRCLCSGYPLGGHTAMLVEAQQVLDRDAEALRAEEALRHVPTLLSVFDAEGALLTRNPAARAVLADGESLAERFVFDSDADCARELLAGGDERQTLEARVHSRCGERWHRVELQHTLDPVTGARMLIASETDISERVAGELALATARERLSALLQNLRGAVLVEDEQRQIVLANQTFCELFGISAPPETLTALDGRNAADTSKDLFRDPERFAAGIENALNARRTVTDTLEMIDGRVLERTYVPVFRGGTCLGHLWQYWDITEQTRRRAELQHAADHDPLTGLWNRRRFEQFLHETHRQSLRYDCPFSLVMIDIDHFKTINDRHGHDVGDLTLRQVAQGVARRLRETDRLARWGGEEFMLLLPHTECEGAQRLADALRQTVGGLSLPSAGQVTVSLGVARANRNEALPVLMKRVDQALLRAKANGRNRVEAAK
ncbi:MAG: diguanylate cyclase [Thioalkalivibrio sp.]|nr:diguanylate cyclase [Thioalkalivibrio sp.]